MNCPGVDRWELVALEALDADQIEPLLAHVRVCGRCREALEAARRGHIQRVRMYEALDLGHEELREQLIASLPPEPDRVAAGMLGRTWRRTGDLLMTMGNAVNRRTAAALLLPAACITLAVLFYSSPAQNRAFAAAIERLRTAATLTCVVRTDVPIEMLGIHADASGKLYLSEKDGTRYEMSANGMLVSVQYVPPSGPITSVNPLGRIYTVIDSTEAAQRDAQDAGSTPAGFLREIRRLQDMAHRALGTRMIGGVEATGFEILGQTLGFAAPGARAELWVDTHGLLPVRLSVEVPDAFAGQTLTMIYENFAWDVPLDPSLFVPEIPADFQRVDATMSAPTEETLVEGLRKFAALTGKYPSSLDMVRVVSELSAGLAAKLAAGEGSMDQAAMVRDSVAIGSGIQFQMRLAKRGIASEYFGDSVTPADSSAVLMRWTLPEGGQRVIYGDLRVETVSE